jgi:hypothetical protein
MIFLKILMADTSFERHFVYRGYLGFSERVPDFLFWFSYRIMQSNKLGQEI